MEYALERRERLIEIVRESGTRMVLLSFCPPCALDCYVINSISGDESLKFTGTQQVVERTISTDKTITAPIVVLYTKAPTETD